MTQHPTLRYGDQSVDGWVEHLQKHLVAHGLHVEPNGTFDDATHHAVVEFQQRTGCIADGVVGDQTWAALRQGEAQMAGTDGEAAHTHVEDTFEARWFAEQNRVDVDPGADEFRLYASNVGSAAFDATTLPYADAVLTTPDGTDVPIQLVPRNWDGHSEALPGQNFFYCGTNAAGLPPGEYKVVATLATELSGDRTEHTFVVGAH